MPAGSGVVTSEPVPGTMVRSPVGANARVFQVHSISLPPGESGLAPSAAGELKAGIMGTFRFKQIRMIEDRVIILNGLKVVVLKFSYVEQGTRLRMHMHSFLTRSKVFACTVVVPDEVSFPFGEEQSFIQSFRLLN